jgi:glucokinase
MSDTIYIGVDLGGTTIKVGLCDQSGNLLHKYEGPTGTEEGAKAVLANIASYVRKIVEDSAFNWDQVAGVGAGIAGFLDIEEGNVRLAPNLNWRNVAVKKVLEEDLEVPVKIDNDANVAALGEAWSGAGKGVEHVVCFTLGTGVGGGIIVNGRLVQGHRGMAGELGHLSVVPDLEAIGCGCGKKGCVETVSSATGIIRMARDAVERGETSSLSLVDPILAKDVFDAAREGDEVALRIVNRAAYYLAKAIAQVTLVLNPQRFVIGGGVSRAGDILFDSIREHFKTCSQDVFHEDTEIVPAILGNDAGMIGAAGLHLR